MMATRHGRAGWPQSTSSSTFAESQRSPPPGAPGASLEHHRGYSPRHPSSSEGLPFPRPSPSPTGPHSAAALPALPPLGAGASGPSAPGPAPINSSTTSPGHSQPILPPLRSLNSPRRPSFPPPLQPPSGHPASPLPPPSHPGPPPPPPPHLPPPPHPYDVNRPYTRGRSPSPSALAPNMGSHIPPPQQQHHGPPHVPPHHGMPVQHGPPPPGYYGGPPPPPPPPGYHHPHVPPGMDPGAYHRMPLPAPMGMMPQHRPSKKEIKRRTKTGCLTCRKRRIKGHPTCRNCEKSKRECLGYDPIFKTQPQPSSIQAAPSVPPSTRPPSLAHGGYPPNSQPYMTPSAHPYPPPLMPSGQPMPPQGYGEFSQATIDPKLEQAEAPIAAPTAIESLLDVGGGRIPPTVQRTEPLSETELTKAKDVYHLLYGSGLDKFFETDWFTTRSWEHIAKNTPVVEKVALLESRFHVTAESDAEANMANQSLEGHILWDLMQLCRQVAASVNSTDPESPDVKHGVQDAAKRIAVFEKLITHQKLDVADIILVPTHSGAVPGAPALPIQLEERKNSFWHHVSKFCTLKMTNSDGGEGATLADIDANLNEVRQLLDSLENRDILYSIAIVSHYMRPGAEPVGKPTSNSDTEGASKVVVARTFMQREATFGTFQVAKVVGGMVLRSWKPKDN